MMSPTREMILKAWHASRRWADATPFIIKMTAAAFAGYALEAAGGDVIAARALIPAEIETSYWGRVHAALDMVAEEEATPRAAAGAR